METKERKKTNKLPESDLVGGGVEAKVVLCTQTDEKKTGSAKTD
jgi:hypothetical protein